jgi:PKD repeat protein
MLKNTSTRSGFLIPRLAVACGLFAAAAALSWFSIAANPPSGTLTDSSGPITYTSGPFLVSNPSGFLGGGPTCSAAQPCDDFQLTVDVPAAMAATHNVVITTRWSNAAEDYDIYLLQAGTIVKDSASSSMPESMTVDAVSGSYTIRIAPFAVAGSTTTTTVQLVEKPSTPPPVEPGPGTPRYHVFAAPPGMGNNSGEPTLGPGKPSPSQPGGPTMYIAGLETLRVTWDDCKSPAGALWEDKSFATTSIVTLDPILFTDYGAGRLSPSRTFVSQLGPKTSFLAYSDDNGETYLQSQGSGINAGVDHQTIGGGPYNPNSVPPPPINPLYPNAIYYASQDVAVAQMARSDTGGQTFGPAVPMYNLTQCGGLHGHIKVAPDGTVYVPNKGCGGMQAVVVSEDNGNTFVVRPIPGTTNSSVDPSVGIDSDGKIYVAMADGDGRAKVAVSADKGVTWSAPVDVGAPFGIKNTVFPAAVGGSGGRAAVQFLATDTGGNYQATGVFTGVWHIYASHTFDGGQTWSTVRVTPENDPVQRGSICTGGTTCGADRNLLDFNDIEMDHEGRIIIAFADGCVGCTSPVGADSRAEKATIARQSGGKRLLAQFDPPEEPNEPAAPAVNSVTREASGLVKVRWSEPDNGGAPITGYRVYRRESSGSYGAPLVTVPANRNSYDDATADENVQYFYKVTAVNAEGESANCGEFEVGDALPVPTPCELPGIQLVADPAGDNTDNPNPQRDIRSLSAAEVYDPALALNKLFITLKVTNLDPLPEPTSRWTVFFTRANPPGSPSDWGPTTEWFVAMVTDDTVSPGTPVYRYGHTSIGTGGVRQLTTDGTVDAGAFSTDGTIRFAISHPTRTNNAATGRNFPPLQTGESLTNINAITQQSGGALLLTVDSTGNGSYGLVGNAACAPNEAPIAALTASPTTGIAPVTVNFDASASTDSDNDNIVTYRFDFGDGTAPVEQASPTISYTYRDSGVYRATVRVKDARNLESANAAAAVIQVGSPLTGIVSRKTHGSGGPQLDINLPTDGPAGIECRNDGSNSHTVVFTFQRDLTAVAEATVTQGNATAGTAAIGPNPNQYTVQLNNVSNAQYVTVTLNGVQDTAGANLTDVRARMAVLNGDTTGNAAVNSSDVSQVKAVSGQPFQLSNYRLDVNANGAITSSDVSQVKAHSGTSLPTSAPAEHVKMHTRAESVDASGEAPVEAPAARSR